SLRHCRAWALCQPHHLASPGAAQRARRLGVSRARRGRTLVPRARPVPGTRCWSLDPMLMPPPRTFCVRLPAASLSSRRVWPLVLLQSASVDRARVPAAPATVTATRVAPASRPVLDGRLDDPAWTLATPIGGLLQRDPQEGAPATERVDVRILYDAEALFIGARLFDASPQSIIRRLGRRDATTHSDEFRVLLDSYHDRRTAFEFIVNAAGAK